MRRLPVIDPRTGRPRAEPEPARGAVSNHSGRFEVAQREAFDDGWGTLDEEPPPLRTEVTDEQTRRIITRNQSPDVPFSQSINPYKGCEHGCIYCFARPTHAYLGLSPGLDFESRIVAKPDAAAALERELAKARYEPSVIALGANTDPYQPVERERKITRAILEVLAAHNHPFGIVTKSTLVLRDLDIIAPMAERNLASVFVSITSLDRTLARCMEPRAASPTARLKAVRTLADAGVPVGVLASPMIPALNDHELENILQAAASAGADTASYILLRLPHEIKDLFFEWARAHYPDRAARIERLVRETRGGELYRSEFGTRMRGTGTYADLLAKRFELARTRYGLGTREIDLDLSQFTIPPKPGEQLDLF